LSDRKCASAGCAIAETIIVAALEHFSGFYLITPFLHYETTSELVKFARSL
jgi:homocysteine S-methyltransferase